MLSQKETEALLANIAELGGKGIKEEDIVYDGDKLVVPMQWRGELGKAVRFLQTKIKEEDEEANFVKQYPYRPYDGAICAFRAMKKAFGMVHGKATYDFFGKHPPVYINVPVSTTEVEEVPWGQFAVPLIEGANFNFSEGRHAEFGRVFQISVSSPRKHRFLIEGLFKLIEEELKVGSIYRGKAFDGQQVPQFLDINVDRDQIVYSEQVQADLEAHIWSVLRYTEQHKKLGLTLKRAILLYGPYGTGKSLAGALTAQEAVHNSWAFIMARPGRDDFLEVMQTARLYQPAVVFFEDAETVTGTNVTDTINQVLDVFDGISAKGASLMVVMTTNHPETIHKAMHRPGRVDAQIEIGALDAHGIQMLIRAAIGNDNLAKDIDWVAVAESAVDYVPAFVKEGADRTVRYALARSGGSVEYTIDTPDLVHAMGGLRAQYERMLGAGEFATREPTLSETVFNAASRAAGQAVSGLASEQPRPDVWDRDALEEARNHKH